MSGFSFIHAADLHIGSPFSNISRIETEMWDYLLGSTFRAFDRMIQLALERDVDFILLCGDLFDSMERNLKALLHFRTGMKRLQAEGIKVFIVCGNHDPLGHGAMPLELPDNCFVFPSSNPRWQVVERAGLCLAAVFGISFRDRSVEDNLALMVPPGPSDLFKIAMLHCTVGQQTGHYPYAPCSLADLTDPSRHQVDYWALGHVHTKKILSKGPLVVYPGVLQGRSFREQGEKGVFLVRVSGDMSTDVTFTPMDDPRWHEIEIDVSAISSVAQLMDDIWTKIQALRQGVGQRGLVLRVLIKGRSELARSLSSLDTIPDMLDELRDGLSGLEPLVWLESIRNLSTSPVDIEARKKSPDLIGMVLKEAEAIKVSPESLEGAKGCLSSLFHSRLFKGNCPEATIEDVSSVLEEAEFLLLDRLED